MCLYPTNEIITKTNQWQTTFMKSQASLHSAVAERALEPLLLAIQKAVAFGLDTGCKEWATAVSLRSVLEKEAALEQMISDAVKSRDLKLIEDALKTVCLVVCLCRTPMSLSYVYVLRPCLNVLRLRSMSYVFVYLHMSMSMSLFISMAMSMPMSCVSCLMPMPMSTTGGRGGKRS
jgi:hypothetical protein